MLRHAFWTRPSGVRVQRVRPAKSGLVQKVQRVLVGAGKAVKDGSFLPNGIL